MKVIDEFRQGIKFEIGSGTNMQFWKDRWCTNRPLMLESPSLFNIMINKDARVADCWVPYKEGGAWNVGLRRRLNDGEIADMTNSIELLNHFQPQPNVEDCIRWLHS